MSLLNYTKKVPKKEEKKIPPPKEKKEEEKKEPKKEIKKKPIEFPKPQPDKPKKDSMGESKDEKSPIWRIKYRPKSLESAKSLYPKVYEQFMGYVSQNNFPHLMLVGPSGSGKTLLAELLAREFLKEDFAFNFDILYADDRISEEERKQAKKETYVSTKHVGSGAGQQRNFRPFIQVRVRPIVSSKKFGNSPFKILVIKNFHTLDVEQQAFRRIMERYSRNCRMILITDEVSSIIDPIISRCQIILVPKIKSHLFNKTVKEICDKENVKINLDGINYVRNMTKGNMGDAIDLIQMTKVEKTIISNKSLNLIHKEMTSQSVKALLMNALTGNFPKIRNTLRNIFWKEHLSREDILIQLNQIILSLPLEDHVRMIFLNLIAQADFESLNANSAEIQLYNLFMKIALVAQEMV